MLFNVRKKFNFWKTSGKVIDAAGATKMGRFWNTAESYKTSGGFQIERGL